MQLFELGRLLMLFVKIVNDHIGFVLADFTLSQLPTNCL